MISVRLEVDLEVCTECQVQLQSDSFHKVLCNRGLKGAPRESEGRHYRCSTDTRHGYAAFYAFLVDECSVTANNANNLLFRECDEWKSCWKGRK